MFESNPMNDKERPNSLNANHEGNPETSLELVSARSDKREVLSRNGVIP